MVIWLIGFMFTNQLRDDKDESLFMAVVFGIINLAAWPIILSNWVQKKVG